MRINVACLIRRKNGIFYVVSYKRGKRVWKTLATKDEHYAKMLFSEMQLSSRKPVQQTLNDFWLMVKPVMEKELSANSIDFYQYVIQKMIDIIGNKRLKGYSTFDFERYKIARLNAVKKITANKELRTLRALFERAVTFGSLESNPARRCRIFTVDNSSPEILSTEDYDRLISIIKDDGFRDIVSIALLTAMRAGEIVNLEWKDIDFTGRIISVKNKPGHRVKMGKERLVPMSDSVALILDGYEKKREKVFFRVDGLPYSVKLVSDKFRKYRKQAGLSGGIHFHSLRHTSISWMHHNGVPSESLRQIAGHSSIQTTHIYTHALPYQLLEAANTLNKNISQIRPENVIE